MSRRPARSPWGLLFAAFVVLAILEIYVIVQVGQLVGAGWTIVLLIAGSVLGTWLIKREGSRAWRALTTTLSEGRTPARELADGALILVGGTLLIAPGFISDVVGLLCILPFTRPVGRRLLTAFVGRRLVVSGAYRSGYGTTYGGEVVTGQVVDGDAGPKR